MNLCNRLPPFRAASQKWHEMVDQRDLSGINTLLHPNAEDGRGIVLEFAAEVGDKALKGIHLIDFDHEGLIIELEVMVRP
jgi:hypothetical protein